MDPIKYILEKPSLSRRIARRQVLLSEYDIVYITRNSVKGSVITDYLAEQPIDDYQPMRFDFPDEYIFETETETANLDRWSMVFDGASNELGHRIGVVLKSPDGKIYPITTKLCFECMHNMAEYEAYSMRLQVTLDMKIKKLKVFRDSLLVIYQLKGEWETKDSKLLSYHRFITKLSQRFDQIFGICDMPLDQSVACRCEQCYTLNTS